MKEIIPLKKDILFKTTIGSITNINVTHDYKVKENVIEGFVILDGSYKMTEASVLEDDFEYKIPFGISINKNINKDTIKIEIDDFKYEIHKDVLNVNIDLELTCDEESSEEKIVFENPIVEEEKSIEDKPIIEEETENNTVEEIKNITTNIISNENKYYTYKVYIFRENDTVESICNKYNITSSDLSLYNDISNLKIGDKLLIPTTNE